MKMLSLDRIGTIGDDRTFGQNITVIRNKTITSGNITNWTIENPFIFTNDEWTEINFSLEYEQLLEHTVNNWDLMKIIIIVLDRI